MNTRINGTKSTFKAYSTHGQLKSRLIPADEFWVGLIKAAAYRGRESVRVNALIDRLVRDTAVTVGLGTRVRFRQKILKESCPITAPVIAGLINNSFQQNISFLRHGNWRKPSQYQKRETRRLYQLITGQFHYCLSCQR